MEVRTLQDHPLSTLNSGTISKHPTEAPEGNVEGCDGNRPVFFNYHEFSERYYIDSTSLTHYSEHGADYGLCVTHFPNVYVPQGSKDFEETRIVRIPRRFDSTIDYPCFSTSLPGSEPAALRNEADQLTFVGHGIYDTAQVFGYSSVSPLSQLLSQEEFEKIVESINDTLRKASNTYSWFNILNLLADILTLGLWNWLCARYFIRDPMLEVEEQIARLNEMESLKERQIKIQSLRRSGYLSHFVVGFSITEAIASTLKN